MPAGKLSPELHKRIIQFVGDRPFNCLQLCLVSKAFQRDAEPLLYQYLPLFTPSAAVSACNTIFESDRHGPLVRFFHFCVEWGNRPRPPPLLRTFWVLVQRALKKMPNLEKLIIYDPGFVNTWIFDTSFPFQLSELKIRFPWDSNLVRFLQSQPKLIFLTPMNKVPVKDNDVETIHLPNLRFLDGSILLAQYIHAPSITNAQFCQLPQEPAKVLPMLRRLPPTLRGLNLADLPEDLSSPALEIISQICPNLRHLGTLCLPITNRQDFIDCLMRIPALRSVELSVGHWNPFTPGIPGLRALAAELKTYCPKMRQIVFWVGSHRVRWVYVDPWGWKHDTSNSGISQPSTSQYWIQVNHMD